MTKIIKPTNIEEHSKLEKIFFELLAAESYYYDMINDFEDEYINKKFKLLNHKRYRIRIKHINHFKKIRKKQNKELEEITKLINKIGRALV